MSEGQLDGIDVLGELDSQLLSMKNRRFVQIVVEVCRPSGAEVPYLSPTYFAIQNKGKDGNIIIN